jgi:hypothetical protein
MRTLTLIKTYVTERPVNAVDISPTHDTVCSFACSICLYAYVSFYLLLLLAESTKGLWNVDTKLAMVLHFVFNCRILVVLLAKCTKFNVIIKWLRWSKVYFVMRFPMDLWFLKLHGVCVYYAWYLCYIFTLLIWEYVRLISYNRANGFAADSVKFHEAK